MFFNSKKVIGIDLGSSSIKLVELEAVSGGYSLVSFGVVPTPPDAISNGQINEAGPLAGAISGLIQDSKTKTKNSVTGMWGSSIIIKRISIPRVDSKVLRETIRFEAEQYIPFDISSVALTHVVLETNQSTDTMDVLVIAAKSDQLVQYVEAISLSGLKCSIMDANSVALANCFELNYGTFPNETIALMNFGAETTNFVVLHNGDLIFCRDIGVGGNSISLEISRSLGISLPEADTFKISALAGAEVPDEVHAIISSEIEKMVEEIKNSFDFFSASNVGFNVSRVFFSGGSAHLSSLIQQVAISLGMTFEKMDPFKKIKVNTKKFNINYLEKISYLAPIAVGLASREAFKE
ncbi:MAG: fimbrial assembly rane protein [Pseudomonadota bacterium]|jgi:type IV pilus assembly protein PilM